VEIWCVRRRWILSLVVVNCIGSGMSGVADQNDPRLGPLFAALKIAPTAEAARPIEEHILEIWSTSGNEAVDALMAEGIAHLNGSDSDAALGLFDRVVALAPGFAEGWNKRATTLYTMGQFAKSVQDIEKVLALEPRHFGALSGLGLCDIRLGRDREAWRCSSVPLRSIRICRAYGRTSRR
jgi:Flp pilus assembly protein TadD